MRFPLLLLLLANALPLSAAPWVAVEVDSAHEVEATQKLVAAGIDTISWSNAVVEVSDFEPLALRPLAQLGLTEADPRWDPWLRGLEHIFRPGQDTALVWVSAQAEDQARALVGSGHRPSGEIGPRTVTGWTLIFLGVLYGVLRLVATLLALPTRGRLWPWIVGVFAVLTLGMVLVVNGSAARHETPQSAGSWLHHRWFQENWPYGARWDDWKPGAAWSYPTVERQAGRLVPVRVDLTKADEAWSQAAWEGLDPRHPARLFGPENP